jgi:amidohydrolase
MSNPDAGSGLMNAELERRMIQIRRHLHRNPELSNQERETQAFLRQVLQEASFDNVRPAAGFGLVVDIVGTAGPSNRKIAIRADMDALPIAEASGVSFSSQRPGVMHACGHDAHAAMGYAAAVLLEREKREFSGTVRMIFQPAEEAEPLGGRRVIEEGLLDDIDAAIGIHVDPYTPTGRIAVGSGPYALASDIFDVVVTGNSAHAAKPSEGADALAIACSMVGELQKIVSREIDPYDPLVISVSGLGGLAQCPRRYPATARRAAGRQ